MAAGNQTEKQAFRGLANDNRRAAFAARAKAFNGGERQATAPRFFAMASLAFRREKRLHIRARAYAGGKEPECEESDQLSNYIHRQLRRFPCRETTGHLHQIRDAMALQDAGGDRGPVAARAMDGNAAIQGYFSQAFL